MMDSVRALLTLFVVSFVLSGCLATSKAIIGPDGQKNQLITCKEMQYCYEKASEVCQKGPYKIVDKTSSIRRDIDDKPETENTLLIKCEN